MAASGDEVISEEIELLEAIYISELSVSRTTGGRPEKVELLLHPATGEDAEKQYVCLTLEICLPETYPAQVPEVHIRNPRGLADEHIDELRCKLQEEAEAKLGETMLYDLIEMTKESLTQSNIPHGKCAVCLDQFNEAEDFSKTECYHYFHCPCLLRYIEHELEKIKVEEKEEEGLKHVEKTERLVVCPVCRKPITYDLKALAKSQKLAEEKIIYTPDKRMKLLQKKMAEQYAMQKKKGGIIDLEAEKNKYLIPQSASTNNMEDIVVKFDEESKSITVKRSFPDRDKWRGRGSGLRSDRWDNSRRRSAGTLKSESRGDSWSDRQKGKLTNRRRDDFMDRKKDFTDITKTSPADQLSEELLRDVHKGSTMMVESQSLNEIHPSSSLLSISSSSSLHRDSNVVQSAKIKEASSIERDINCDESSGANSFCNEIETCAGDIDGNSKELDFRRNNRVDKDDGISTIDDDKLNSNVDGLSTNLVNFTLGDDLIQSGLSKHVNDEGKAQDKPNDSVKKLHNEEKMQRDQSQYSNKRGGRYGSGNHREDHNYRYSDKNERRSGYNRGYNRGNHRGSGSHNNDNRDSKSSSRQGSLYGDKYSYRDKRDYVPKGNYKYDDKAGPKSDFRTKDTNNKRDLTSPHVNSMIDQCDSSPSGQNDNHDSSQSTGAATLALSNSTANKEFPTGDLYKKPHGQNKNGEDRQSRENSQKWSKTQREDRPLYSGNSRRETNNRRFLNRDNDQQYKGSSRHYSKGIITDKHREHSRNVTSVNKESQMDINNRSGSANEKTVCSSSSMNSTSLGLNNPGQQEAEDKQADNNKSVGENSTPKRRDNEFASVNSGQCGSGYNRVRKTQDKRQQLERNHSYRSESGYNTNKSTDKQRCYSNEANSQGYSGCDNSRDFGVSSHSSSACHSVEGERKGAMPRKASHNHHKEKPRNESNQHKSKQSDHGNRFNDRGAKIKVAEKQKQPHLHDEQPGVDTGKINQHEGKPTSELLLSGGADNKSRHSIKKSIAGPHVDMTNNSNKTSECLPNESIKRKPLSAPPGFKTKALPPGFQQTPKLNSDKQNCDPPPGFS